MSKAKGLGLGAWGLGRDRGNVFMNHSFQGSAQGPAGAVEFQVGKGELTLTLLWHYLTEILPRGADDSCMSPAWGLPRTGTQILGSTSHSIIRGQYGLWPRTLSGVPHLHLRCFDHWPQLGSPSQQRIHRMLSPLPQVLPTPCWTHPIC